MTPEEIQALQQQAAELKARAEAAERKVAESQERIQAAAKIQKGYLTLKESNPQAAEYLDAIARGTTPEPFWREEAESLDEPDAIQALEQRLTGLLEKKINDLGALVNHRFEAVAKPVLGIQAQRAEESVRNAVTQQYPGFDWNDFKAKAPELAGIRKDLLEDEQGLLLLAKNYWVDKAADAGYQRAQQEYRDQAQLESSILMPDSYAGDRSVEADPFDGIDATDLPSMLEKARTLAVGR